LCFLKFIGNSIHKFYCKTSTNIFAKFNEVFVTNKRSEKKRRKGTKGKGGGGEE